MCCGGKGRLLPVILGAATMCGCEAITRTLGPRDEGPGPILQRMQRSYPDLASGRFVSLADFESPGQELLFRVVGPDGQQADRAQPVLSILRARNETGAGGLKVQLAGPADALLLDGERSPSLAMPRDWRAYGLLLISTYGPPDGALLRVAVESGDPPQRRRWVHALPADPGWTIHRLDVASIGDWIDLADVRRMCWHLSDDAGPVEFYLDDIILADNRRDVVPPGNDPNALYVYTSGHRICVGAPDRFELAFADGQLVGWRAPDAENLADPAGLGPWPVPLDPDWAEQGEVAFAYDDPAMFSGWGTRVAARQVVREASVFRAVIEGQWSYLSSESAGAPETAPGHRWQYTIYPTGQVFVLVKSVPADDWPRERVGYAVGLSGRADFRRPHDPEERATAFTLLTRSGARRADLLWTWLPQAELNRARLLASEDETRLAVVVGATTAAGTVETAHCFRVWPPDLEGLPEAESLARDYSQPARLTVQTGALFTDAPGDLDHDGFNEAEGCYELTCESQLLRAMFDPANALRFDPLLRIRAAAGVHCWVYVRGRPLESTARDSGGNLLFRLGRVTSAAVLVEVHCAP